MSLAAAVNQMYVFREAMNGCKNLKDSLKGCFENVNIKSEQKVRATDECFIVIRAGDKSVEEVQ